MDSVESVEKEIDKVLSKFVEAKCNTAASIDDVISIFTVVLNSLRGKQETGFDLLSFMAFLDFG